MNSGSTDDTPPLSRDVAFEILTNARRRYVLEYLRRQAGPVTVSDLAEYVAASERGTRVESLTSKERKSVYTSLYQTHLPKMADIGVVEYERQRGTVRRTERASRLERYLSPETRRTWSRYYLALAGLGVGLLVAQTLGVEPVADLSPLGCATLVLALFAGLAVVNIVVERRARISRGDGTS